jgi:tRNA(Glu) U13 pseudouridine synthase TruD
MEGARRPYRVPVEDLRVEVAAPDVLAISFALPKGSYAACVLREITKQSAPTEEE